MTVRKMLLCVLTCRAAVDSSLGRESISTSTSFAVLAIRAANSWAYSGQRFQRVEPKQKVQG